MSTIAERAQHPVSLKWFDDLNFPEYISAVDLKPPKGSQYILRMLIKEPFAEFKIPDEYQWVKPMLIIAEANQKRSNIRHPFCYLTIRHGIVASENDDVWHTDGFSQTITHLPEQNYVWVNQFPTEYFAKEIQFPNDFDTFKYNVHLYLQDNSPAVYHKVVSKNVYCLDPYVIHRRPKNSTGKQRTMVRISFTPIEIADVNNTSNPLIYRNYTRDGIKIFRDNLQRYK